MNVKQYCDAVIRLGRERGRSITQADAESSLPNALDALAAAVASDDRAPLLQRRFQLTYTGLTGDAPFSSMTLDDGNSLASVNIDQIITETIGTVKYDDGSSVRTFHRIAGDSEIDYERQQEFQYYDPYIVLNAKIRARVASDPPDQGTLADGFLSFQSNYKPLLAGLPSSGELNSDLIIFGVEMSTSTPMGDAANG